MGWQWHQLDHMQTICFSLQTDSHTNTSSHTHPFNGPFSGTTQLSRYQKGKTNRDFAEARDSEWQWHQLGYMQVCTLLQTDNHSSIPALSFLQAGCPSCRPTNSVKALKAFKALKVQLIPLHPKTPLSLASFKSRLVLPFWYRLTQVVLEKRPLNRCSSSSSVWCNQNLSNRAFDDLVVPASSIELGRLFQILTIRSQRNVCVCHNERND